MKAHILISAEPLVQGRTYQAQCGAEVKRSYFVFTFDEEFGQSVTFNAMLCCAKCLSSQMGAGRYIYGLVEDQEMRGSEVA